MTRFDTPFGETGRIEPPSRLKPYAGYYKFQGRTWSIRVWAHSFKDAEEYCANHNLRLTGEVLRELPSEPE